MQILAQKALLLVRISSMHMDFSLSRCGWTNQWISICPEQAQKMA
jgi:hypothetical protein